MKDEQHLMGHETLTACLIELSDMCTVRADKLLVERGPWQVTLNWRKMAKRLYKESQRAARYRI